MFKVEIAGLGFKVSLGDGKRGGYRASDIEEVKQTLEHYFRRPWHEQGRDNCPLCRLPALSGMN